MADELYLSDGFINNHWVGRPTVEQVRQVIAENAALRHDNDLAQEEMGLKAAAVLELTEQRDALLESMKWVVTQTTLLHGVGRSIEKEDIWTIKEHAERAIKQVQP